MEMIITTIMNVPCVFSHSAISAAFFSIFIGGGVSFLRILDDKPTVWDSRNIAIALSVFHKIELAQIFGPHNNSKRSNCKISVILGDNNCFF